MVNSLAVMNHKVDSWVDVRLLFTTLSRGVMAYVFFSRKFNFFLFFVVVVV